MSKPSFDMELDLCLTLEEVQQRCVTDDPQSFKDMIVADWLAMHRELSLRASASAPQQQAGTAVCENSVSDERLRDAAQEVLDACCWKEHDPTDVSDIDFSKLSMALPKLNAALSSPAPHNPPEPIPDHSVTVASSEGTVGVGQPGGDSAQQQAKAAEGRK